MELRPEDMVFALLIAIDEENPDAARRLCTPRAWKRARDAVERFYAQAVENHFVATVRGCRQAGTRASVRTLLSKGAITVGEVHFFMVASDGHWLIDGLSPSQTTADAFLRGAISANFQWRDLRESPQLLAWAGRFAEAFADPKHPFREQAGKNGVQHLLSAWEGRSPTILVESTHYGEALGVGAFQLTVVDTAQMRHTYWVYISGNEASGFSAEDWTEYPSLETLIHISARRTG